MKNFKFLASLLTCLFLFVFVIALSAQEVILPGSAAELFGLQEALYGSLVMLGGYLSYAIPGLKNIDNGVYRVLAWAVLTALGFIMFGVSDVLSLALTYAASTSVYEVILKLIFKSRKPQAG